MRFPIRPLTSALLVGLCVSATAEADCKDLWKAPPKKESRESPTDQRPLFADRSEDPLDLAIEREDRERLEELLDALPPDQAAVLRLRYIEGKSLTEIAELLSLTQGAVARLSKKGRSEARKLDSRQRTPKATAQVPLASMPSPILPTGPIRDPHQGLRERVQNFFDSKNRLPSQKEAEKIKSRLEYELKTYRRLNPEHEVREREWFQEVHDELRLIEDLKGAGYHLERNLGPERLLVRFISIEDQATLTGLRMRGVLGLSGRGKEALRLPGLLQTTRPYDVWMLVAIARSSGLVGWDEFMDIRLSQKKWSKLPEWLGISGPLTARALREWGEQHP